MFWFENHFLGITHIYLPQWMIPPRKRGDRIMLNLMLWTHWWMTSYGSTSSGTFFSLPVFKSLASFKLLLKSIWLIIYSIMMMLIRAINVLVCDNTQSEGDCCTLRDSCWWNRFQLKADVSLCQETLDFRVFLQQPRPDWNKASALLIPITHQSVSLLINAGMDFHWKEWIVWYSNAQ